MKFEEVMVKLDNSTCKTRNVTNEVMTAVKQTIETNYKEYGLDVTVNKISNAELFVKKFYNAAGYSVIRGGNMGYRNCDIEDDYPSTFSNLLHIETELKRKCEEENCKPNFYETDGNDKNKRGRYHFGFKANGVPDFFVYKYDENGQITEAFFVEVKSRNDSLSYNQFMWFLKYPYSGLVKKMQQHKMSRYNW